MNDNALIIDQYLDTQGLLCPEPVMMLHAAVRELKIGEVLEMLATDPSTLRDVPKFCLFLGHELLSKSERGASLVYIIRKSV